MAENPQHVQHGDPVIALFGNEFFATGGYGNQLAVAAASVAEAT